MRKVKILGDISEIANWLQTSAYTILHCSLDSSYSTAPWAMLSANASQAVRQLSTLKSLPLKRLRWWTVLEGFIRFCSSGVFVICISGNIWTFFAQNLLLESSKNQPITSLGKSNPIGIPFNVPSILCLRQFFTRRLNENQTCCKVSWRPYVKTLWLASAGFASAGFISLRLKRRKNTNSLSLNVLISSRHKEPNTWNHSHTPGKKRTLPAAHFIQVAAPQRWSRGCQHAVAVCWEHTQHERLMRRAENGGRQPWLLAILWDVLLRQWIRETKWTKVRMSSRWIASSTWCWQTNSGGVYCTLHLYWPNIFRLSRWWDKDLMQYLPIISIINVESKLDSQSLVCRSPFQVHFKSIWSPYKYFSRVQ